MYLSLLILPKLQEHIHNNSLSNGINQLKNYSSKLDAVVEHIQNNHSNNRKIVFCNFKEEMNQLYTRLIQSDNYNINNVVVMMVLWILKVVVLLFQTRN